MTNPDIAYIKVEPIVKVKGEKTMKDTITNVALKGINAATRFCKNHPILSYVGLVGPGVLLMAAGYVALQEGFYSTEDEKKEEN